MKAKPTPGSGPAQCGARGVCPPAAAPGAGNGGGDHLHLTPDIGVVPALLVLDLA